MHGLRGASREKCVRLLQVSNTGVLPSPAPAWPQQPLRQLSVPGVCLQIHAHLFSSPDPSLCGSQYRFQSSLLWTPPATPGSQVRNLQPQLSLRRYLAFQAQAQTHWDPVPAHLLVGPCDTPTTKDPGTWPCFARGASLTYTLCFEPIGLFAAPTQFVLNPKSGSPRLTFFHPSGSPLPSAGHLTAVYKARLSYQSPLMSPPLANTAFIILSSIVLL